MTAIIARLIVQLPPKPGTSNYGTADILTDSQSSVLCKHLLLRQNFLKNSLFCR